MAKINKQTINNKQQQFIIIVCLENGFFFQKLHHNFNGKLDQMHLSTSNSHNFFQIIINSQLSSLIKNLLKLCFTISLNKLL